MKGEDVAELTMKTQIEVINRLIERQSGNEFDVAVNSILQCKGRVMIISGIMEEKSGQNIATTLMTSTGGRPSVFFHSSENLHENSDIIGEGDVVILISYSGDASEVVSVLTYLERSLPDVPVIGMTGNAESAVGSRCTIHLNVTVPNEECSLGLAPIAILVLGDALAMSLMMQKEFQLENLVSSSTEPDAPTFPFDSVAVISSDATTAAAAVASSGPLSNLSLPPKVGIISTSHPYGPCMGSGGATLAALDLADKRHLRSATKLQQQQHFHRSVLILHHGIDDSSLCPNQIALGKAWTSLPCAASSDFSPHYHCPSQEYHGTDIGNPTSGHIGTLGRLFRNVPRGTLVVATTDVFFTIPPSTQVDLSACHHAHVLGLSVPAPLETAKNHIVYVLDDTNKADDDNNNNNKWKPRQIHRFLQKPTIDCMRQTKGATFQRDDATMEPQLAWTDTGVVVFLPQAAAILRRLASTVLRHCTAIGLRDLYEDYKSLAEAYVDNNEPLLSLEDYASAIAPKVELYTHMIMTFLRSGIPSTKQDEPAQHSNLPIPVLAEICRALSPPKFAMMLAIPTGNFFHLDTSRELIDFLSYGGGWNTNDHRLPTVPHPTLASQQQFSALVSQRYRYRDFGRMIQLARRAKTLLVLPRSQDDNDDRMPVVEYNVVVTNTIIVAGSYDHSMAQENINEDGSSFVENSIGEGTVIEHCNLQCPSGLSIGRHCLISGACGQSKIPVFIPDGTSLQILPVKNNTSGNCSKCIYICIGIDDTIDECQTLHGLNIEVFFQHTDLTPEDLWNHEDDDDRMLLNAKLHPVIEVSQDAVTSFEFEKLFAWVRWIKQNNDKATQPPPPPHDDARKSLLLWKNTPRLALSEIRIYADANAEFARRDELSLSILPQARVSHLEGMRRILMERRHERCLLAFVVDSFVATGATSDLDEALALLDGVVMESFASGAFDVMGRTFMVMSTLFADMVSAAIVMDDSKTKISTDALTYETQCQEWPFLMESLRRGACLSPEERKNHRAVSDILERRNALLKTESAFLLGQERLTLCAEMTELASSAATEVCVSGLSNKSRDFSDQSSRMMPRIKPVPIRTWVTASAPARIDLAGGWSDTPPVSYEHGGAVSGIAVMVDGHKPLLARCRVVLASSSSTKSAVYLAVEAMTKNEFGETSYDDLSIVSEVCAKTLRDLCDYRDPHASCALLKCALVYFGLASLDEIVSPEQMSDEEFQRRVNVFCGRSEDSEPLSLEIICTSLLPRGSGMGSSSILGGCILAAMAACVGIDILGKTSKTNGESNDDRLIHAVLMLEQLLTTGGGWQDQVCGLVGGIKIGLSAGQLPLCTSVKRIALPTETLHKLEERLVLVFTGQPRLAKNILQNVLRRWGRRNPEIVRTVRELVDGANASVNALLGGDINAVGRCLHENWQRKKIMTGQDSGVEPELVNKVITGLLERGDILGGSLCGAGGGGFMVLFTKEGRTSDDLKDIVENQLDNSVALNARKLFTWHKCLISPEGLAVSVAKEEGDEVMNNKNCGTIVMQL